MTIQRILQTVNYSKVPPEEYLHARLIVVLVTSSTRRRSTEYNTPYVQFHSMVIVSYLSD